MRCGDDVGCRDVMKIRKKKHKKYQTETIIGARGNSDTDRRPTGTSSSNESCRVLRF